MPNKGLIPFCVHKELFALTKCLIFLLCCFLSERKIVFLPTCERRKGGSVLAWAIRVFGDCLTGKIVIKCQAPPGIIVL